MPTAREEVTMSTSDVANNQYKEVDAAVASAEALLGEAEPWEDWETKLVLGSVAIAVVGLVILGVLINMFVLP